MSDLGNGEIFCHEKNFNDRGVAIDKCLFNETMENACVWDEEEKLSLTNIATKMTEANNMAFQVCFNTKPSEKKVMEDLQELKAAPKGAKVKELAKQCLSGHENTMICRLSKAEGKLGRSLVIDLPTQGYRQVDHRSIKWLVIDNVKYIVKK